MSCVTCDMSGVKCQVSRVRCHMSGNTCQVIHVRCQIYKYIYFFFLLFFNKVVELVEVGSVFKGTYPFQFSCKLYRFYIL